MVSSDDNRILNSPYCYYDEHDGNFYLKKEHNSVTNLIKKLKELAKKGLYNFKNSSGKTPQILLSINQTKKTGQMTRNEIALNGPFSCVYAPLVRMLLDSVFLNQSLSFQGLGLTLRSPGKFIFIDRIASSESNPFDDRFLGQWMITSVSHHFSQSTYMTEVVANKIDCFSTIWPEEDPNF
jgi:hypothetical protein